MHEAHPLAIQYTEVFSAVSLKSLIEAFGSANQAKLLVQFIVARVETHRWNANVPV